MKYSAFLWVLALGLALTSCTSPRYASTTEYDDVYYSSSDETVPPSTASDRSASTRYDRDDPYSERSSVDSYYDTYYDDDDFVYSRRLRRFHQSANRSFRYYDPFYSNDLYFVMGTPTWNRWYNQYGWYDWGNPRFASPMDPFGPRMQFGWYSNPNFYRWNSWNAGYYNPYVAAYYGYDPFWGPSAWDYGFYNTRGWNNLGYYCPPAYYRRPAFVVNNARRQVSTPTVTRRRAATASGRSQSVIRSRQASRNSGSSTSRATAQTSTRDRNNGYLRPRQPVRSASPAEVQRTVRNSRSTASPARSSSSVNRNSSPRSSSPRVNSSRNQSRTSPRRSSSTPRSSGYSSPRRNSSSVSRPNSSRSSSNRSSTRSNRSSKPRSSGGGGSRRRNN